MIAMMPNWAHSAVTMTSRLEKRSEIQPAMGEKRTNGRMMIAARMVLIIFAFASALCGNNSGATTTPQGHEHELGGIVIDQHLHLHRDK